MVRDTVSTNDSGISAVSDEGDRPSRLPAADPLSMIPRIITKLYSWWVVSTYPFAHVGKGLSLHFTCELKRSIAPRVRIGDSVMIAKDAWLNIAEAASSPAPAIILEDGCKIARRSMISAKNLVHLGRNVILSAGVLLQDHAHAYENTEIPIDEQGVTEGGRLIIQEGCWIGQSAAIICNSGEMVIGKNSVIAANAVLSKSVPPYSIVAGNPARVVKQFDPVQRKWVLGGTRPGV